MGVEEDGNLESVRAASKDGLTVAPSLDLVVEAAQVPPPQEAPIDQRTVALCALAVVVGIAGAFTAAALLKLIEFFTNLAFYGRLSFADVSPADNQLGPWVIGVPIVGALIVGVMARYGSQAIRGHGIPEAMEQILINRSRIPVRITFLKPLSAALAIGTGGPFGAEGPIIATGSALGSMFGQLWRVTAAERRTLLAAGAAAGMSATFASPVAAVLLAIELLLNEFRARSIIPVAFASCAAAGMRTLILGPGPVFTMNDLAAPTLIALAFYVLLGGLMGVVAAGVTRIVYAIEDAFAKIPIHWMWWPAIGAVAVGVIGFAEPRTLGVGYRNISDLLWDHWTIQTALILATLKFLSWSISLGSGTSGGTLAPMLTIGGGLGAAAGLAVSHLAPAAGIDSRMAALVGMASLFAGASRAMLASAVLAFETTLQPMSLLPLLGGCVTSTMISSLLVRHSIMTEKIARRGLRPPAGYSADALDQATVGEVGTKAVIALKATDTVAAVRKWLLSDEEGSRHQGFPVLNKNGVLVGVLTRRDLLRAETASTKRIEELILRSPKFVYEDTSVGQAAEHMVNHHVGRLPIVTRKQPARVVGIITRGDVLHCYRRKTDENVLEPPTLTFANLRKRRAKKT